MRKLFVLALTAGLLMAFAPSGQAHTGHQKTQDGREFDGTTCGTGGGCVFQKQSDGDVRIYSTYSGSNSRIYWNFQNPLGHLNYAELNWVHAINAQNCVDAGYEAWVSFPDPGVTRFHIRLNGTGSCTIRTVTVGFTSF